MKIFEFIDHRGFGVYSKWYDTLEVRQQASLDARLKAVRQMGDMAPSFFEGPVKYRSKTYPHTLKLKVSGNVKMRLLSCLGPKDISADWTILNPVIETGGKYPDGCFAEAEDRRTLLLANMTLRREVKDDED